MESAKKLFRRLRSVQSEVKIFFPRHRLHVSFADEPHKATEENLIIAFAQKLYKEYMEIDDAEEVHIPLSFAVWFTSVFHFDYDDEVILTLLYKDIRIRYRDR